MSILDRYYDLDPDFRRKLKVAALAAVGVIFLLFIFLYDQDTIGSNGNGRSGSTEVTQVGQTTTSTQPGTVEGDPPIESGEFEGIADDPYTATTVPSVTNEPDFNEGFGEAVVTAAQADGIWPALQSGMNAANRKQVSDLGAALVRARATGEGCENFSTVFKTPRDPDQPMVTDFAVEFSVAMSSTFKQNGAPLFRTVVGWRGTDPSGIRFAQVRVANYFTLENGQYYAVSTGNLPEDLQRTDGLLKGITIYAD